MGTSEVYSAALHGPTEGDIDSASVYELVNLYRFAPSDAYLWAWQSSLEVTLAVIEATHLSLAVSPSSANAADGPYGFLVSRIINTLGERHLLLERRSPKNRLATTVGWARANRDRLRFLVDQFHSQSPSKLSPWDGTSSKWLDNYVAFNWPEHSKRLEGLFDEKLIPSIAAVLELPETDVRWAWRMSKNCDAVTAYGKKQPESDSVFVNMRNAFIVAALLRGRFHDYTAADLGRNVLHHPMRDPVLRALRNRESREYLIATNTEQFFAKIIVAASFSERTIRGRLELWTANVRRARDAFEDIDLRGRTNDDAALRSAVDQARRIGVRAHPRYIDLTIDVCQTLGLGTITSFFVDSWQAFSITAASVPISITGGLGSRAGRAVIDRPSRLRDLGLSVPGRIVRKWN